MAKTYLRPTNTQCLLGAFTDAGQVLTIDELRARSGLRKNAFSGTISCLIGLKRLERLKKEGVICYQLPAPSNQ